MKLLLSSDGAWKAGSATLKKYNIIIFRRAVACIDYPRAKITNVVVVMSGG